MPEVDQVGEAKRFARALSFVLREETSYTQPEGSPYTRLIATEESNARRHRKGLPPLPLGVYALVDGSLLCRETGVVIPIPDRPDGLAFDDHPRDPGGRTGMGILQREYDAWRRRRGLPVRDVWLISDDEIRAIYMRQYWIAARCSDLAPGLGEMVFNTAVNCGVGLSIRQLQMAVGVRVDGHLGEATLDAMRGAVTSDVVRRLHEAQRRRYPTLEHFDDFGANWLARNERATAFALSLVRDLPPNSNWEVDVAHEVGMPDDRSARAHEEPPADITQSSTAQAAKFADWTARLGPVLPLTKLMHEFTAAGKSMLSLEFALAALSSPDVLTAIGVAVAVSTACRHVIARRARSILHMGV